ncbi:MAG: extracellular solute-binding protein [Phycisphaerales bacterium]|nr:extracellular solute-binding protein [Phycisphaerales bacterium]
MKPIPGSVVLAFGGVSGIVVLGLIVLATPRNAPNRLDVLCAVVLAPNVQAAAADFERKTGLQMVVQAGGSGALLNQIKMKPSGDLFVPADAGYLDDDAGLFASRVRIGRLTPVLAVPGGNPKNVLSLEDAVARGLRIGFANPETAAIGRVAKGALKARGQWEATSRAITVMKPTVGDVSADLLLGATDVAVVWDTTIDTINASAGAANQRLTAVIDPAFDGAYGEVVGAVLRSSRHPERAAQFLGFLAESQPDLPASPAGDAITP